MDRILLKSKLYGIKVTDATVNYDGSIAIDANWLQEVGICQYEQVNVLSVTNGKRFITYALNTDREQVCVYGAAAKLVNIGDELIVLAYGISSKPIKPQIEGKYGSGNSS